MVNNHINVRPVAKILYTSGQFGFLSLSVEHIRKVFQDNLGIIFVLHKNICCGYSLELPHRGDSNEYPQYMFL